MSDIFEDYPVIANCIADRANQRLSELDWADALLRDIFSAAGGFYIGGGCLLKGAPNDIDIFPKTRYSLCRSLLEKSEIAVVSTTKNATTLSRNGCILQICNYQHDSLENLVKSFDFAHIQVGVDIALRAGCFGVVHAYFTPGFVEYSGIGDSTFCGSEYPLSSLIRLMKYRERGAISKGSSVSALLSILSAFLERGFSSYEDFKDQLDAVDLGMVPEDIRSLDSGCLLSIFHHFRVGGDD